VPGSIPGARTASFVPGPIEYSGPEDEVAVTQLAELRESDAITPAEYEEHKRKLLAKLARDTTR
jgi:hypothetical protein